MIGELASTRVSAARPRATARRLEASPALLLGGIFFLVISALAVARHHAFATGRHDLEIYTQVSWGLANGAPFATTLLRSNTLHLAEHLALVLLPLAPLYGLLPDPRLLLVLQQLALSLAALAVGWWARRRLSPAAALLVLASILFSPALAAIGLDDFHAITLAALPLALGMVFALEGCPRVALLTVLLAALMEEEAALGLAGLGLLLIARRQRPFGASAVLLGGMLLGLTTLVIMPAFHAQGTLPAGVGTRSAGHFAGVGSQPGLVADRLLGSRGRDALTDFLLPSGGLALLSPSILAAGLPTFLALLLQDRDDTFTRHWSAPVLPAVWLATVASLALFRGRPRLVGLALLALGMVAGYIVASPLPGGGAYTSSELVRGPREQALERAVALVPPGVPTVASANVTAHLANRRELFAYPIDDQYLRALEYERRPIEAYVLDLDDPTAQRVSALSRNSPLTASPPYVVQSTAHKILVLTRAAPRPAYPLDLLYGRGMAFKGYDLSRIGDRLRVTFHWERVGGISADFRRVAELLDASGRVVADDGELELTRTLQTQKWQIGQQVRDEVELPIPPDAGSELKVRVQWLNRDQRRPILLQDGSTGVEIPL